MSDRNRKDLKDRAARVSKKAWKNYMSAPEADEDQALAVLREAARIWGWFYKTSDIKNLSEDEIEKKIKHLEDRGIK